MSVTSTIVNLDAWNFFGEFLEKFHGDDNINSDNINNNDNNIDNNDNKNIKDNNSTDFKSNP